ncbi:hypothetical protein CAP48_13505 [Advenella sp. S44]|uniref:hypothetical protein n=1 Tax=Advenella sp. S44 TaxID=1982755 RepID=UPI000C2B3224|nr:hypothetical protein [Advenella sp. S44]PJX23070.1 hypothetical protein CAP48_13505 [Advenella sp. S44]
MNMDYREPRNGDFASYVEELSRHFDMKEQAVNPDFSSGFPSKLIDTTSQGNRATAASGAPASSKQKQAANQPTADIGFPVPPSGKQHTGFETRPVAQSQKKPRSFPVSLVLGLVAVVLFILINAFETNGRRLDLDGMGGPLIFILVVLFIIYKRIRNAAKRFPTSVTTKKQI